MDEQSRFRTSRTLLERVRNGEGWDEFVARYGDLIYRWCIRQGLDEGYAQDATQETFSRLTESLKRFEYDPTKGKFRSWLWKTTSFAVKDMLRRIGRTPGRGTGSIDGEDPVVSVADSQKLVDEIAVRLLFDEAEARVLDEACPWHVEAWAMCREGREPDAIAQALGEEPNAVRVALCRIRRRVERLFHDLNEP